MAVIVETGAGLRNANSYVNRTYVAAYLTNLDREDDWTAAAEAVQNAACVAATQYMETVFGARFKGSRRYTFSPIHANGSLSFAGQPSNGQTITVGQRVYRFVNALEQEDDILIGGSVAATQANVEDAINGVADGVTVHEDTEANEEATATVNGTFVDLVAVAPGKSGDFTALATNASNVTANAFAGGSDGGSQPLSFPRVCLYDRSGNLVTGVPRVIRDACAEYADRARSALLLADPTVDPTGQIVQRLREKVGPIETEVAYNEGGSLQTLIKPYPAADMMFADLLLPAGGAFR